MKTFREKTGICDFLYDIEHNKLKLLDFKIADRTWIQRKNQETNLKRWMSTQ